MKVLITVEVNNGTAYPERYSNAKVAIDARETQRGSNTITKGLVEACGAATVKVAEAMKR